MEMNPTQVMANFEALDAVIATLHERAEIAEARVKELEAQLAKIREAWKDYKRVSNPTYLRGQEYFDVRKKMEDALK